MGYRTVPVLVLALTPAVLGGGVGSYLYRGAQDNDAVEPAATIDWFRRPAPGTDPVA